MTTLSVNINKVATLRNARGGNLPDVLKVALDCEQFGAQGITVHPRPDERHIRYSDVRQLKPILSTEFNIEGRPVASFMELVLEIRPHQVTLVPDAEDALTSNCGWDTTKHRKYLSEIIQTLKAAGIRTSIFVDPDEAMVWGAAETGTDRIELYTEAYATYYEANRKQAIAPYIRAAEAAREAKLEVNAGHDLSLVNLSYFVRCIPWIKEVSIGHALICDALYRGLEPTIRAYREQLL